MRSHEIIERTCWTFLFGAAMLMSASAKAAGVNMYDGQWHFSVTPYAWLPEVNGKFRFNVPPGQGGAPEVNVDAGDYLSDLNFVAMISGEARKGSLAFAMDLIYLDIGDLESTVRNVRGPAGDPSIPIDSTVNTDLKTLVWQGVASYTVMRTPSASVDVLGGVRYAGIEPRLSSEAGWARDRRIVPVVIGIHRALANRLAR